MTQDFVDALMIACEKEGVPYLIILGSKTGDGALVFSDLEKWKPRRDCTHCSAATGSPYGLADYRNAMVEARRERDGLSSQLLAQSIDASEWLDAVASALGIQVGRESWWEGSEEDRRQKILARINSALPNPRSDTTRNESH